MATTTTTNGIAQAKPPTPAEIIFDHVPPITYNFRFSPFLRKQYQIGLPADRRLCKAFQSGVCPQGTHCAERHTTEGRPRGHHATGLNSLVCKHWLRGLCKKGDNCEFLHEYNLRKMPECNFFMRNGYCSNGEECLYLHIDPLSRLPPCPHYKMGFCPLGPLCSKKHVRRKLCVFYLAGFCPDGPQCKRGVHPKWSKSLDKPTLLADEDVRAEALAQRTEEGERPRDGGRDREGRFGRYGRGGGGGGKWRGSRDRRFRGRQH